MVAKGEEAAAHIYSQNLIIKQMPMTFYSLSKIIILILCTHALSRECFIFPSFTSPGEFL